MRANIIKVHYLCEHVITNTHCFVQLIYTTMKVNYWGQSLENVGFGDVHKSSVFVLTMVSRRFRGTLMLDPCF